MQSNEFVAVDGQLVGRVPVRAVSQKVRCKPVKLFRAAEIAHRLAVVAAEKIRSPRAR